MNLNTIPAPVAPEALVNLASSQIERNARIGKMLAETATKTFVGSVERNAHLTVALSNELGAMAVEAVDAAANFASAALAPFAPAAESAKASKK
ncbi:MAG: hypothetical protein HY816_17685 [Candidatus Wallbacteria bacterium]|nr:hypothetical protein [Candidatus Wallbacteria bacterium]